MKAVTLTLTKDQAEAFSNGLSDILCICIGIKVANPDMYAEFLGVETIRELNIKLKRAIEEAEK